jgi:hypothetical protein
MRKCQLLYKGLIVFFYYYRETYVSKTTRNKKNQTKYITLYPKFVQGHDTTAAGSSFFLCLMGAHPEIQVNRVHDWLSSSFRLNVFVFNFRSRKKL